jgi:hypothetical protein
MVGFLLKTFRTCLSSSLTLLAQPLISPHALPAVLFVIFNFVWRADVHYSVSHLIAGSTIRSNCRKFVVICYVDMQGCDDGYVDDMKLRF